MSELMKGLKRTHKATELSEGNINEEVVVMGWVNKKRIFRQHIFITIRDVSGIIQVVFDETKVDKAMFDKANSIKGEYVIAVKGVVSARTEENLNLEMKTGKIEVVPSELRILAESDPLPFSPADVGVKDDLRLKYRYIDLRRPDLQNNFITRAKMAQSVREFYSNEGFIEFETPILLKSTPEGARDYLVPSRIHNGKFYALPQSPQTLKQILMVSGFDRYFQIVKCFRDEDLRADRQPEFTQIDTECSFVDVEDIIDINERLVQKLFKDILNYEVTLPINQMKYEEAMEKYGSDKPDIRFDVFINDITDVVKGSEFEFFEGVIKDGGSIRAIVAPSGNSLPRKQIDSLVLAAKDNGAKGLAWINIADDGAVKSTISKFFTDEQLKNIAKSVNAQNGDLILICADQTEKALNALGAVRVDLGKRLGLYDPKDFKFVWITEFPLLEWSEEDNRFAAKHHPFTMAMDEDIALFDSDPSAIRAKAYDLVINGYEVGGGSIRISSQELQQKMFKALGFSEEEAQDRFGFLLDAFKYGVPPHGGLAFGFDRLVMILTGTEDIRDVIAFPKVKDASCLLTNAPDVVEDSQLDELGLNIIKINEEEK